MPNTTNFNWSTPADTDLVKNGASAIRTLGNSIDTSFVDLKGGTTGQVLKKTSNTDLDFEWGTASSGLTLINTTSISGVTSQSVNNVFSSTYDNYLILFDYYANGGASSFRLRASGTDNSNSNYITRGWGVPDSPGGEYPIQSNSQTSCALGTVSTSANFGARHVMQVLGPNLNQATSMYTDSQYSTSTSSSEGYFYRCTLRENYQATGFTLINGANMTGSLSVYGYAK